MTIKDLEKRLAALEAEVHELRNGSRESGRGDLGSCVARPSRDVSRRPQLLGGGEGRGGVPQVSRAGPRAKEEAVLGLAANMLVLDTDILTHIQHGSGTLFDRISERAGNNR